MNSFSHIKPNILITGTPGVGKSTLCKKLLNATGFTWLEVSRIAKEHNCLLKDKDKVYQCPVIDDDKLLDVMEPVIFQGGNIVDYHSCDFFPEFWFDVIFVLVTDKTILNDRLIEKGFTGKKLMDNINTEVLQTVLKEAKESFDNNIVHGLKNNTLEQLEENFIRICFWIQNWKRKHKTK